MTQSVCAFCEEPAKSHCSGCSSVYYCSKQHQRKHWKSHKSSCCCYKEAIDDVLGRHLVAIRNIKQGELILKDFPIVTGPKQFSDAICLGCYTPIHDKKFICDCGFPMCNMKCSQQRVHQRECAEIQRQGGRVDVDTELSPNPSYMCVTALRCLLLRHEDGIQWQRLQQLQTHDQERRAAGRHQEADEQVFQSLRSLGMPVELPDVHQVCGALDVNGFDMPTHNVIGLFSRASLLEHNCVPNTYRTFCDDMSLVVRANRAIAKSDHITTSYTDPLWGTGNRRYFLQQTKFFSCDCRRCADPSELGSELSSLRCGRCNEGVVRALQPLDCDTSWKCSLCPGQTSCSEVNQLVQTIGEQLVQMEKGSIKAAELFLKQYSGQLAASHFYMCDIKTALVMLYGKDQMEDGCQMNLQQACRKQTLADELLQILAKVNPGRSRLRGILLYELQTGILRRSQIEVETGCLSTEQWKLRAAECVEYLRESYTQLSEEPVLSSEYAMAQRAGVERDALYQVLTYSQQQQQHQQQQQQHQQQEQK